MKVNVYIDNSNVFKNIRKINESLEDSYWVQMYDPLELSKSLVGSRELGKVYFYCVPPPAWLLSESDESRNRHAMASKYYSAVDKLDKVEIKYGYLQGGKSESQEKNVDTQICSDMVAHAALGECDAVVLVSNDGDFTSALENTKKLGKRVEVLFFRGYFSGALRKSSDITRRARKSFFKRISL